MQKTWTFIRNLHRSDRQPVIVRGKLAWPGAHAWHRFFSLWKVHCLHGPSGGPTSSSSSRFVPCPNSVSLSCGWLKLRRGLENIKISRHLCMTDIPDERNIFKQNNVCENKTIQSVNRTVTHKTVNNIHDKEWFEMFYEDFKFLLTFEIVLIFYWIAGITFLSSHPCHRHWLSYSSFKGLATRNRFVPLVRLVVCGTTLQQTRGFNRFNPRVPREETPRSDTCKSLGERTATLGTRAFYWFFFIRTEHFFHYILFHSHSSRWSLF